MQWGNSSIPYTNFTIKNSENILSGYITITFPINFTNSCKHVSNNRTYIHTNQGWESGGITAHSVNTNSFNSYAWLLPNIVFIEGTTNLDGVGASYLSIGY